MGSQEIDRSKITWEEKAVAGAVIEVTGTTPEGATQLDVKMAMRIAENPNMPRFKSFTSGGKFKLTYFND